MRLPDTMKEAHYRREVRRQFERLAEYESRPERFDDRTLEDAIASGGDIGAFHWAIRQYMYRRVLIREGEIDARRRPRAIRDYLVRVLDEEGRAYGVEPDRVRDIIACEWKLTRDKLRKILCNRPETST